jgi:hypothetical protein
MIYPAQSTSFLLGQQIDNSPSLMAQLVVWNYLLLYAHMVQYAKLALVLKKQNCGTLENPIIVVSSFSRTSFPRPCPALRPLVIGVCARLVLPKPKFPYLNFRRSQYQSLFLHFTLIFSPSLLDSYPFQTIMANHQEPTKKDALTGMAHSEAHYFNR